MSAQTNNRTLFQFNSQDDTVFVNVIHAYVAVNRLTVH